MPQALSQPFFVFAKATPMQKMTSLSRAALVFPLALVLYEFSVYIANDMVQPSMITVVREYGASAEWIPRSMTAFLLGGTLLTWLLGPLSDRIGRRPVMLAGVALFIVSCLAILLAWNIESYMLIRVVQGLGLCFIGAVGYAAVQEAFDEKTAVKVMALMANVALIAPLVGPVLGAALMTVLPWRASFLLIALVAIVALLGLFRKMPETVKPQEGRLSLGGIARQYSVLFRDGHFMAASGSVVLLGTPLIVWIGLSPILLMENAGMSPMQYGLWQFPVIGGLILGNLLLVRLADRWPLGRSVSRSMGIVMAGAVLTLPAIWLPQQAHYFFMAGVGLMAFAEGLSFAVLYRFAMTASTQGGGVTAAAVGMMFMGGYALLLELSSRLFSHYGVSGLALMLLATTAGYSLLVPGVIQRSMAAREAVAEA